MTGWLFIRHASGDHVGRVLAGRTAGTGLNARGVREAETLAGRLADSPVRAVYTSPLVRARATAEPIARALGLEPRVVPAFTEVDFGGWTGRSLEDLEGDDEWRWWNESRSTARPPEGEAMVDVLARGLQAVHELTEAHQDEWVAVISHCDVIRPLLAHFAGMPLDRMLSLEVAPASISAVRLDPWGARILAVNQCCTPGWPWGAAG